MSLERFKANIVENVEGCWIWMLSVNHQGYGLFWVNDTYVAAHRWAYLTLTGAIPEGLQLDHLCRRRDCVNPAHLEPVTGKENCRRAMKDHCGSGHPYNEENTYIDRKGRRDCKTCRREAVRSWRDRVSRTV